MKTALEICQLFDLSLVSEIHVMRKQYLDGSIPTGFQRTAMMGLAGIIPFQVPELGVDRALRIRQLSLEEDACREISDIGHRITFMTDRLGMPLTEVVTEPDFLTPWEVREGGRLIALTTRSADHVRRGPGAARQDVNVSVAGGRRVEIKGVDEHRGLPRLVHIEGFRQLNLLRIREELRRRGVTAAMLELPGVKRSWEESPLVIDATAVLGRSDFAPVRDALAQGGMAAALKLPGFGGLLTHRTQPGITFANEFADRVRVIACLTARPFMIHSDIEGYGLGPAEWRQLRTTLRAGDGDTVVALWGVERDVETAVREVFIRAREALQGVPAETRQAFMPQGTTGFERILPGADRMYPDTDTPPVPIPDAWVEEIRRRLPERPWERVSRLRDLGLAETTARELIASPWGRLFEELAPATGEPARRLAHALRKRLPHFHREFGTRDLPPLERLQPLARALESGTLRPEATDAALDRILREPRTSTPDILEAFLPRGDEAEDLKHQLEILVVRAPRLGGKPRDVWIRWGMGMVMPGFLGRLDPARVAAAVEAALAEVMEEVGDE